MSTDDAYTSFLDKANADLDAGRQQQAAPSAATATRASAVDADEPVPPALVGVEAFYASETDEPFEPVVMRWGKGGLPDETQLSALISSPSLSADQLSIAALSPASFDPRGQYGDVMVAVQAAAGNEETRVFRVEMGMGARVEYYVLGLEREARRVVGLRARAVES
ncbi:hypothetical protein PHISP_07480 [Aspergillus sp. HF37]|nr:hypothetical protein PHISP_07480 [Aspergillus sp. HF37]